VKPKSVWLLGWDTGFSRTVGATAGVPVSELKLILARETALVEIAGMTVESWRKDQRHPGKGTHDQR